MSTTTFSAGDILLTLVPFTDGSGQKHRPILVVSTASYNKRLDHVTYCPITSTEVPFAAYHPVDLAEGSLGVKSNVIVDTVFTVTQSKIAKKVGRATDEMMSRVLRDVHANIALPPKK